MPAMDIQPHFPAAESVNNQGIARPMFIKGNIFRPDIAHSYPDGNATSLRRGTNQPGIIAIRRINHGTVFRQAPRQRTFFFRNGVPGTEKFNMGRTNRRNQADEGAGHRTQRRQFPCVVHPHLPNGGGILRRSLQNAERNADMVVEITLRRRHPESLGKDSKSQIFRRCFTTGTCHADDHQRRQAIPPPTGQLLQGNQRIFHHNHRAVRGIHFDGTAYHNGRSPPGCSLGSKCVTVELLSAQGKKDHSLLHNPAIRTNRTAKDAISRSREQSSLDDAGQLRGGQVIHKWEKGGIIIAPESRFRASEHGGYGQNR